MNTKKHTPGPWKVCDDFTNVFAPESDTAITNQDDNCYPFATEAQANAAFIVHACNNHDRMLVALKELYRVTESRTEPQVNGLRESYRQAFSDAREAIEQAEE